MICVFVTVPDVNVCIVSALATNKQNTHTVHITTHSAQSFSVSMTDWSHILTLFVVQVPVLLVAYYTILYGNVSFYVSLHEAITGVSPWLRICI